MIEKWILSALAVFFVVLDAGAEVEVFTGQRTVPGREYVLAAWAFNDATSFETVTASSHGNGILTTDFPVAEYPGNGGLRTYAGSEINVLPGDLAGEALAVVNAANNGKSITFQVATLGFEGIAMSYATRGTGTGFRDHVWAWSLDGEEFSEIGRISGRTESEFSLQTMNFGEVAELAEQETVWLRVRFEGATSGTGNNRIDNVRVSGIAVEGPPADGAGTATFLNGSSSNSLGGTNIFRLSELVSFELTVETTGDAVIESVAFQLPNNWTGLAYQNGSYSGGFAGAIPRMSGNGLVLTNVEVGPGQPGILYLRMVVTPWTTPEGLGVEEVIVETALAGGELTAIAELPTIRYAMPVDRVREVEANGVPVALGETVAVEGTATVASGVFNPSRFSIYLQDETGGVAVDHPELHSVGGGAVVGQRYVALGRISFYNGLTQIALEGSDTFYYVPVRGDEAPPEPMERTIAELLVEPEKFEGMLVRIPRVSRVGESPEWPTNGGFASVPVTDGTGELILYINQYTDIPYDFNPSLEWPLDVVGIFNQFDETAPYSAGYQILPRAYADFWPASELAGFAAWRTGHFDAGDERGDRERDPDGDGLENLLEYAFGGDPWSDSREKWPKVEWGIAAVGISFWRAREADDLEYRVESSEDLREWVEIWNSVDFPYDSNADFVKEIVSEPQAASDGGRRFLRVKVTIGQ